MIPHPHYLQSPVSSASVSQRNEGHRDRRPSVEDFREGDEFAVKRGLGTQAGSSRSVETSGFQASQLSLEVPHRPPTPSHHDDDHSPEPDNPMGGAGPALSDPGPPSGLIPESSAGPSTSPVDAPNSLLRYKTAPPSTTSTSGATATAATARPRPRLRSSVSRLIHLSRATNLIQSPGAEQGIDPRRDSAAEHWGHLHQQCSIEVIDYSSIRSSFTTFDNASFSEFMNADGKNRPEWARVRWINVGGISFDVVRILALRYDLHPLATEDVLRCFEDAESGRSKSDYYREHLFLSIIAHTLSPDDAPPSYDEATDGEGLPDSGADHDGETVSTTTSRTPMRGRIPSTGDRKRRRSSLWQRAKDTGVKFRRSFTHDDIESVFQGKDSAVADDNDDGPDDLNSPGPTGAKSRWAEMSDVSAIGRRKAVNSAALKELKRGSHVGVELKHVYVFLTRGGTLITIHQDVSAPDFFAPIMHRLKVRDTLLRAHCDASLLMQSVLDLVVDKALEVVDRYHDTLLDLERQILIKPSVKSVRQLHIMSGDITLHKRTLTPLSTLVYSLRRYDQDRAIASYPADTVGDGSEEGKPKIQGFCSHQAKVYLADVYDHMEYILSSMDMFSSIAENLINFTFNIVSYETNQSMRRLTIATVVFFPLTFLTGYFGMNFSQMQSLQGSDLFFWEVAIPIMSCIIFLFTYPDIAKFIRAFRRNKMWEKQVALFRRPRRRQKV